MTEINLSLTVAEAHQVLRALAGRKHTFRKTADTPTLNTILAAQNKVIVLLNEYQAAQEAVRKEQAETVDTEPTKPVRSTRKRRTTAKED